MSENTNPQEERNLRTFNARRANNTIRQRFEEAVKERAKVARLAIRREMAFAVAARTEELTEKYNARQLQERIVKLKREKAAIEERQFKERQEITDRIADAQQLITDLGFHEERDWKNRDSICRREGEPPLIQFEISRCSAAGRELQTTQAPFQERLERLNALERETKEKVWTAVLCEDLDQAMEALRKECENIVEIV